MVSKEVEERNPRAVVAAVLFGELAVESDAEVSGFGAGMLLATGKVQCSRQGTRVLQFDCELRKRCAANRDAYDRSARIRLVPICRKHHTIRYHKQRQYRAGDHHKFSVCIPFLVSTHDNPHVLV